MPSRRTFLTGVLAAGLTPRPSWADAGAPEFLAAARQEDGRFVLSGIRSNGDIVFSVPLPDRGHAGAAHPMRPEAVAFARRPGTFSLVLDCRTGSVLSRLNAPAERHFYGHGVFSSDGTRLYTTENAYEEGEGRIGIWDAANGYTRIGEFWSGGIGPHEIIRLPGTETLVVANGGIDTHPDSGRAKLNVPVMAPNLSYIEPAGDIVETHGLPDAWHMNSIRHLCVRSDGLVAAGLQWQGGEADAPPLLLTHRMGSVPVFHSFPRHAHQNMDGYAGSVAFSGSGDQFAITSPRGGRIQVFEAMSGAPLTQVAADDVCGLSQARNGFFVTTGTGKVSHLSTTGQLAEVAKYALAWDNHVVPIRPADN